MLTIIWDIDDVLNHLMRDWLEQEWKPRHPHCPLGYSEICENPPHRVLGVSEREYLESLDIFRLSATASQMLPNATVVKWFAAHGRRSRHIAATSRPLDMAGPAAEWVLRHFGAYIRTFAVVPCRCRANVPRYDTTKGEFLAWWGKADILVDDCRETISAAVQLGIRAVLFPQPWNGGGSTATALRQLTELTGC
jgi:hypothetical protein